QVQRSVPLDNRVAALVRGYAELHREVAGGADPLLVSERGGPLGYMGVYNRVRRIGQQAGVSGLTAQALRGTFIVRQFDLHSDVLRVQRLAGHAHPKTTARHLSRTIQCDACGARVRVADTHRIDSGHRLCPACMRDIRQPRP
ncbi:MAG: tyrosine-type recombinase/integrase, partial [Phycisphaerae bacterium]|nr:tyrosine-type recombinase/integrase [Phycisphaerae bacterium]